MDTFFLLHITDPHLSADPIVAEDIDRKLRLLNVTSLDRNGVFERSLDAVAEFLKAQNANLAATLLGGDYKQGGKPDDPDYIHNKLAEKLRDLGWSPETTVAVPGNHDLPRASAPSSSERYSAFLNVWRDKGYKTPILDGVDGNGEELRNRALTKPFEHAVVVPSLSEGGSAPIVVVPLNSSNWSHTQVEEYSTLHEIVTSGLREYSAKRSEIERLEKLFDSLLIHDAAMVSRDQREAISALLGTVGTKADAHTITILLTHHHLLPVSAAEEHKTTESFMNLGAIRQFLANSKVDIVVHGHKHKEAIYRDLMPTGDAGLGDERDVLVIGGGSHDPQSDYVVSPCRLIRLDGLPHVPSVTVLPIHVPYHGAGPRALWVKTNGKKALITQRRDRHTPACPIVLSGTDIDALYDQVKETVSEPGTSDGARVLICHLDLSDDDSSSGTSQRLPFPRDYDTEVDALPNWVPNLVGWWQRSASRSEQRIPYIHGVRLSRYDGYKDQIERIGKLLKTPMGRRPGPVGVTMADAVAVLLDPVRDLPEDPSPRDDKKPRGYLAFCLAQFVFRSEKGNDFIDIVAYYRTQEYHYWWPVNVAELVHLVREVSRKAGFSVRVGRVTTVTPIAQYTDARLTPTRVAIPVIDQLVDADPHLLGFMVDALLLSPNDRTEQHDRFWQTWDECIKDMELYTRGLNEYGHTVALAGIDFVIERIEKSGQHRSGRGKELLDLFGDIRSANESFDRSDMNRADFDKWSQPTSRHLRRLRRLVEGMQ